MPHFGQKDIATITREEVKRLAYGLLAQGKSRSTAKGVLTPLSGMLSMAVEDGHLTSNPALRVLKRSRAAEGKQQDRIQPFTGGEVSLLLETCREHYPGHYALVLLLVRAGLRIGEALALRWDDVDFNGRFAEVRQTWSNHRLTTTKGNRRRRVDLWLHLTETLKALSVERKKETLQKGWGEVPELVFISHRGTRLLRWNFYEWVWKKLLRKAGLRYVRIHDLRHSCAALLLGAGVQPQSVAGFLGHSDVKTTLNIYSHVGQAQNREAAATLDRLLGREQTMQPTFDWP